MPVVSSRLRAAVVAVAAAAALPSLLTAAVASPVTTTGPGQGDGVQADGSDPGALERLDGAVTATSETPLRGQVTVASFGRGGPQVTTVELVRRADGRTRVSRGGAWELGTDGDGSYLRSPRTGQLLELGGLPTAGFDRTRFLAGYKVLDGGSSQLDTGPAHRLEVVDRGDGRVRETLHVDRATGLVVRRETVDVDGMPVRVVAYTQLEVDDGVEARRSEVEDDEELERETLALDPVERRALERRGIPASASLPGGFDLLDASEIRSAETPTVHLRYGDGLYTLSVYVQLGTLAGGATRDAVLLDLPDGDGAVWRWPGSEPRRVVWTGDRHTFTALTDAPTGVLLAAVAGLPNDPPPSTLERLTRGWTRVTDRLLPWR